MASAHDIEDLMKSIIGGNDEESTVDMFLDTGFPPLNAALAAKWAGGLPVGRLVEIFGPPSSGKTAIATAAMASAQRAGGIAMFMDHERSFSLKLAPQLGLDISPNRFIFKKPKTFEESLTLVIKAATAIRKAKLIPDSAPICAVFDSLAGMVPQSALYDMKTGVEKEAGDRSMNDNTALARATSAAFPAFNQHVEDLNICGIFLNQTRTKIGVVYGDPTTTPGGDAPKFWFSVRISLTASRITKGSDSKDVLGQEITARVVKNKVARPFKIAKWRFVFQEDGTGRFDVERSLIEFLIEQKILKLAGAYIEWIDGKKYYRDGLAEKILKEGSIKELIALLPADYEAPVDVVAEAEEAAVVEKKARGGK